MPISHVDVTNDLRRITISGRLDTPGTNSIASQLMELTAAPKKSVVIDLSDVPYLASIGIGALITSAKTVSQRGAKMALVVGDSDMVMMCLEATGVDQLVPIFRDLPEAEKAAAS